MREGCTVHSASSRGRLSRLSSTCVTGGVRGSWPSRPRSPLLAAACASCCLTSSASSGSPCSWPEPAPLLCCEEAPALAPPLAPLLAPGARG